MKKKSALKFLDKPWPKKNHAEIVKIDGEEALILLLPDVQVTDYTDFANYCDGRSGWTEPKNLGKMAHIITKRGYYSYFPDVKEWNAYSYEFAHDNAKVWGGAEEEDFDNTVVKFAAKNFGIHYGDPYDIEWQIRANKKRRTNNNKQKRINAHIRHICPPLPAGFTRWAKAQGDGAYIKLFQKTNCAGENQPHIQLPKTIERMFCVDEDRITEFCIAECQGFGMPWERWYYGEHYGSAGRQQEFWDKKTGLINNLPNKYIVYDNFDSLGMPEEWKSCLRIMSGKAEPSYIINAVDNVPELEYVIKGGYCRLARELSEGRDDAARVSIRTLKALGKKQQEMVKKYDGGAWLVSVLFACPYLKEEHIKDLAKIRSSEKMWKINELMETRLNLNHIFTLLKKTDGGLLEATLQTYLDYLDMAQKKGEEISDEIIYRNKRWHHFHDAYVEELNRKKYEEKKKQFQGIQKDFKRNAKHFAWESKNYVMEVPKSYTDIVDEGTRQHHCVGASDRYMLKMAIRETFILFLRHKDAPDTPYYTIEAKWNGSILQAYSAFDRKPEWDEVNKVLQEWSKEVRKKASIEADLEAV